MMGSRGMKWTNLLFLRIYIARSPGTIFTSKMRPFALDSKRYFPSKACLIMSEADTPSPCALTALHFYSLPSLFSQNSQLTESAWFEPSAYVPLLTSKPFSNSDLRVTLWGVENEEKMYRRRTGRYHIDTTVGVPDCLAYVELIILRAITSTGLERTAKAFHIPLTTLRGLLSMKYLPMHLFPPENNLCLLIQQGLFECYLTHIAERTAGSRSGSGLTKEEEELAKTVKEGEEGDDMGVQQVLTPSGATYYPKKFKEMILEQLLSGKRKVAHLAKEYRLYTSIINNWKRSYLKQKVVESSKSLSCNTTKEMLLAFQNLENEDK